MTLLDRYLLRNFLEPFLLALGSFLSLWLVFDLSDHGTEFLKGGASLAQVGEFYLSQLPQILLLATPVAVLLALLFSCSRMSRSNEIISMLASGRSLPRVLLPLFGVGVFLSLCCLGLNHSLAPRAEAAKREALSNLRGSRSQVNPRDVVEGHLFRDRLSNRTWFVRRLRPNGSVLEGVQVLQQDDQGNIRRKWYATRAVHDPATKRWTLQRGMIVDVNTEGEVLKIDNFQEQGQRQIDDWAETPWRIASSRLDPLQLTTPELEEYLRNNSDFNSFQLAPFRTTLQDRWALPWSNLLVVFLAAPLSIIHSRRGILQSVGAAILLFFLLLMSRSLFLALGRANRLDPATAAWGPLAALFLAGLFLLWLRSANRDFASLFLRRNA
jgi:lipopolysaccharide export system permease protein